MSKTGGGTLSAAAERPKLEDLARKVGVSIATVSRVVNGRKGVSREVRQTVLAAMDELGYERPERARSATKGQVGIIVPDLTLSSTLPAWGIRKWALPSAPTASSPAGRSWPGSAQRSPNTWASLTQIPIWPPACSRWRGDRVPPMSFWTPGTQQLCVPPM